MSMSDPLGDMLTRIRNGQNARKSVVSSPASRFRSNVLEVLKREGYIWPSLFMNSLVLCSMQARWELLIAASVVNTLTSDPPAYLFCAPPWFAELLLSTEREPSCCSAYLHGDGASRSTSL